MLGYENKERHTTVSYLDYGNGFVAANGGGIQDLYDGLYPDVENYKWGIQELRPLLGSRSFSLATGEGTYLPIYQSGAGSTESLLTEETLPDRQHLLPQVVAKKLGLLVPKEPPFVDMRGVNDNYAWETRGGQDAEDPRAPGDFPIFRDLPVLLVGEQLVIQEATVLLGWLRRLNLEYLLYSKRTHPGNFAWMKSQVSEKGLMGFIRETLVPLWEGLWECPSFHWVQRGFSWDLVSQADIQEVPNASWLLDNMLSSGDVKDLEDEIIANAEMEFEDFEGASDALKVLLEVLGDEGLYRGIQSGFPEAETLHTEGSNDGEIEYISLADAPGSLSLEDLNWSEGEDSDGDETASKVASYQGLDWKDAPDEGLIHHSTLSSWSSRTRPDAEGLLPLWGSNWLVSQLGLVPAEWVQWDLGMVAVIPDITDPEPPMEALVGVWESSSVTEMFAALRPLKHVAKAVLYRMAELRQREGMSVEAGVMSAGNYTISVTKGPQREIDFLGETKAVLDFLLHHRWGRLQEANPESPNHQIVVTYPKAQRVETLSPSVDPKELLSEYDFAQLPRLFHKGFVTPFGKYATRGPVGDPRLLPFVGTLAHWSVVTKNLLHVSKEVYEEFWACLKRVSSLKTAPGWCRYLGSVIDNLLRGGSVPLSSKEIDGVFQIVFGMPDERTKEWYDGIGLIPFLSEAFTWAVDAQVNLDETGMVVTLTPRKPKTTTNNQPATNVEEEKVVNYLISEFAETGFGFKTSRKSGGVLIQSFAPTVPWTVTDLEGFVNKFIEFNKAFGVRKSLKTSTGYLLYGGKGEGK